MNSAFFPQRPFVTPTIYAYSDTRYPGMLKIGYTNRNVVDRMKEHYPTITPTKSWKVEWTASAVRSDGTTFMDHEIHRYLDKHGVSNVSGEWYRCNASQVQVAYLAVLNRTDNDEQRTLNFAMRPEQNAAVNKTIAYFNSVKDEDVIPKFLWNCKMRFGKTFATYELAKKLGYKRVLILTFKPAVQSAWEEDLKLHLDFEGWQFVSRLGKTYEECDKSKPIVCFGSFQDYLGTNESGGIKAKNEWVHSIQWDLVVFDEYHFGAWTENAKKLFKEQDEESEDDSINASGNAIDETWLPITADHYLYLSGTPFRAINSGEFIEEQVYNWTYSDEQREKNNWDDSKGNNPYESLPRIVLMTYKLPESIIRVARNTDLNEFDLNEFFRADGNKVEAKFVHENEVQKWLDLIRGGLDISVDEMRVGTRGQSFLPFKETALLNVLNHTLWFLPNVASCYAMSNLLAQRQNVFYHDYHVNVCAGTEAGTGLDALPPVQKSMEDPLNSKTITLSCGKLTTGVTVKPWTGIFMLRGISTPETYFQSAFRVQSPWTMKNEDGTDTVIKQECYIFDFAIDRALRQISDYATKLDINETNPEKKVADFINFLPVLAYQDGVMQEIDAGQILDIAMSGTTASLLARRWESALLVNVDNNTLKRLLANERAMAVLMKIEGFRSLNSDITAIITKSEDVKKLKKKDNPTPREKKQISEEEKEFKSKRKMIQEKLIKFATRIPVFMYLTDFREYSLKDVITKLEPSLFKKVTGLEVEDFNLLVSLGIFNEVLMNDAVYKFKRYEDSSLEYVGINMHAGEKVGGFSTVITDEEYKALYGLQQKSLEGFTQQVKKPTIVKVIPTQKVTTEQVKKVIEADAKPTVTAGVAKPVTVASPKPVKQDTFDTAGIVVGARVKHKAFGEGTIIKLDTRVQVKFDDVSYKGNGLFAYPAAFKQGFLTLVK